MKMNKSQIVSKDYLSRYQDDPVRWSEEVLDVQLWSSQKKILSSVFNNRKTVVRAAHSVGKTFIAGVAVLAFLYLKTPSKVITTASSGYQVKDLLWSEINHLFKEKLVPKGFPGECLTTRFKILDDWFAVGLSPREEVNFQGYHSKNILIILDEAPGVRPDVVSGSESLMSGGNAHSLWIGNPISEQDHFGRAFSDPSFKGKFKISAFDSPNFTREEIPSSVSQQLLSREWVIEKARKWGTNSPLYFTKILAEFPPSDSSTVIPYSLSEGSRRTDDEKEDSSKDSSLGVDVARSGSDLTVFTIRRGQSILLQETQSKSNLMEIARRISILHEEEHFSSINIDSIGMGAGVIDRLKEMNEDYPLNSIDSRTSPTNDRYADKRTQLWFNFKEFLQGGGTLPDDDGLIQELSAPKYSLDSRGKMKLERKKKTKKLINRSPDKADSAVYSIADMISSSQTIDPTEEGFHVPSQPAGNYKKLRE